MSPISKLRNTGSIKVHLEVLPGVAAWAQLIHQLNKLSAGKRVVFLTAGAEDQTALQKYLFKPVMVKSLVSDGVLEALREAEPQVIVVPRLVARELDAATHEIYSQRILALLEAGYTIETTLPMVAYDGVNDLLRPQIPWPSYAQVNGTFLRNNVSQYVLCDISPQSILNRMSRGLATQSEQGTPTYQHQGLNLANIHRLREFMLRLATAHAADTTRQATLSPVTLVEKSPWSPAAWSFSWRENFFSLGVTIFFSTVLGYFFVTEVISLTAFAMGLLAVSLITSFGSNALTTLVSGIVATFMVGCLAWLGEANAIGAPLLTGDIVMIVSVIWAALISLKLRYHEEHRQTLEENQTRTLMRLVYDVGSIRMPDDILEQALLNLQQSLGLQTVHLPLEESVLQHQGRRNLSAEDLHNAQQAVLSGTLQKPSTAEEYLWCPVLAGDEIIAVLGVRHKHRQQSLVDPTFEFVNFIRNYCRLIGGAMRRAQYEIERSEASQLASRESLRSSLLASVSHDLKTPLVSIIGSLSMLDYVRDGLPGPERQELVSSALTEAERLHRIVHNVLEMAKLESGMHLSSRTPVDPVESLQFVLKRVQKSYPQALIEVRDFSEGKLIWGDELLLSQVFTNLVENAAKYGLKDQPIELRLQADHANNQLLIEVSSVGNPVAEEDLARIFDKFYRSQFVDSKTAGSGLGLAICRAIVEAHDGTITAEIVQGVPGGMKFIVALPAMNPGQEMKQGA